MAARVVNPGDVQRPNPQIPHNNVFPTNLDRTRVVKQFPVHQPSTDSAASFSPCSTSSFVPSFFTNTSTSPNRVNIAMPMKCYTAWVAAHAGRRFQSHCSTCNRYSGHVEVENHSDGFSGRENRETPGGAPCGQLHRAVT